MDYLKQDIQYAFRRLFKSPGFTLVAVATLALGIGANSAIFSVVNGVLLRPLPYPEPDRLVGVYHVTEGQREVMSGPNFIDATGAAKSLENAAAINSTDITLTGEGEPVRIDIARVSASLFNVLRVRPMLGRTFNADENTPGKTDVVVLSHALWKGRFGGDPSIVGRHITLDGVSKEILVAAGVASGTIAALLVSKTITKMLFSVAPTDPVTFGSVAAVLVAVALFASYLPARRATRVDPIVALRAE